MWLRHWMTLHNFFLLQFMYDTENDLNHTERWGWIKKSKNWLNRENRKKNNWNNWTVKKNQLNRFKFWKNWPVRFYKPETEKTKLNRTQNEKNREKTTLISLSIHPHLMNKHTSLIVFRNKNHRRRSIMKYYYSFLEN